MINLKKIKEGRVKSKVKVRFFMNNQLEIKGIKLIK